MTNDRTSCSIRPGFLRATIKSRSWIIKLWQFYSLSFPSKENERAKERYHIKEVIARCQCVGYLCPQIYFSSCILYEIQVENLTKANQMGLVYRYISVLDTATFLSLLLITYKDVEYESGPTARFSNIGVQLVVQLAFSCSFDRQLCRFTQLAI